jgi:hypothetical protein
MVGGPRAVLATAATPAATPAPAFAMLVGSRRWRNPRCRGLNAARRGKRSLGAAHDRRVGRLRRRLGPGVAFRLARIVSLTVPSAAAVSGCIGGCRFNRALRRAAGRGAPFVAAILIRSTPVAAGLAVVAPRCPPVAPAIAARVPVAGVAALTRGPRLAGALRRRAGIGGRRRCRDLRR